MAAEDRITANACLPDELRLLGQVCAVFTPLAVVPSRIESLLEDAALAPLRPPNDTPMERQLEGLAAMGVAKRNANGEIVVVSDWGLRILREAREEGALLPILGAVARLKERESADRYVTAPGPRGHLDVRDRDYRTARVLVRGYLLAGEVKRLDEAGALRIEGRDLDLLAEPFAEEALRALPPAILPAARAACLAWVIDSAAPAEVLIAFCDEVSEKPLDHAPAIAYIRALQGRLEAAEAVFDALPATVQQTATVRVGKTSTRALVAMLRGQDEQARSHIEEVLNLLKGNRKRLIWPNDPAFSLALLALVRLDAPDALELLENIAASYSYDDRHERGLRFAQHAASIKVKSGSSYDFGRWHGGMAALLDGIRSCWLGGLPKEGQELIEELRTLRQRATVSGFDWVVAECDEVLHRLVPDSAPVGDDDAPDHAKLGTVTLTTLSLPPRSWAANLATLEELANGDEEASQQAQPASSGRLLWTLHQRAGAVFLEPRAQRRGRNGAWTRGKQYGAKRLAAESTKMEFLLAQDREAIAAVSTRVIWHKQDDYFGIASLYALAGHPYVVDEDGKPVEVVRREPELAVDSGADGGVVARITPARSGTDGPYHAEMTSPGRCEVTFFDPAHRSLWHAVSGEGLRLPADAKGRFLKALPQLARSVRVASSLPSAEAETDAETGTFVDADSIPWVRLEPLDAGLSVALEVEPIPNSSVCFPPGSGGPVVFARREGENVRTQRDLDGERLAAEELADRCPPLVSLPSALHPLSLPDPDDCLELLELLDAADARCRWPRGESLRVVSRALPRSLRMSMKSAAQWMQVSAELPVDDERALDLRQLLELVEQRNGSRFLPLGNGEFLALTDTFRRQLDDFANLATPSAKGRMRLDPLAALAVEDLIESTQLETDESWPALRDKMQAATTFEPTVPSTLQAELRPYQLEGYQWLARLSRWGVGACLADDMGLGKTLQTLAMLLDRATGGPALVVAPTSVVPNWLAEAHRFAPTLQASTYGGTTAARTAQLEEAGPFDVLVTTYGLLQNDADALIGVSWHTVVLDEAQAIKNPSAKRSQAAKELQADFRVITTGTPVQNNLMDLHSLFGFANPRLLGSLRQFRLRFALPIERDRNAEAQARLRRLISPFVLRRLKTDVLNDLPPRTEITLHVKLSEEEASLYEALRQQALDELAKAADGGRMRLLAHLTRLRLACCSPRLILDADDAPDDLPPATTSAKLATFATTLAELLDNRHKVLVFSQFVTHLALVEEHLRETGVRYQYLDGSTPAKERAARIKAFQAGDGDVFLISLTAGGVGLNLTAADYVIHMDPWWNPAVEDQASDRAHRIGQTRPVTIYRLVAEGTIEEQIVDLHHTKRDLAEQLLKGTDAPARMDMEEMMALLRQPFSG